MSAGRSTRLSGESLNDFGYSFRFGQIRAVEIYVNIKFNVPLINIQRITDVLFGIFFKTQVKDDKHSA